MLNFFIGNVEIVSMKKHVFEYEEDSISSMLEERTKLEKRFFLKVFERTIWRKERCLHEYVDNEKEFQVIFLGRFIIII